MNKILNTKRSVITTAIFYGIVLAGALTIMNACRKGASSGNANDVDAKKTQSLVSMASLPQDQPITKILTVAAIRSGSGGNSEVMFLENTQVLNVYDPATLANLQTAYKTGTPLKVTFNPWQATVTAAIPATTAEIANHRSQRTASDVSGYVMKFDNIPVNIDNTPELSAINLTTSDSLTAVIPDMATAQQIFNFMSNQCCRLPGPYDVDFCITYQYTPDGCYARAQMMCWLMNRKYHYATQKVFSFANAGSDELCVQADKWGGCCINWWYHVAPLVTINTDQGPKAYVMDPAMFLQPVPLSQWLHGQENPACVPSGDRPHVTMINVQPTKSYQPTDGTGLHFDTDPTFSQTDTTLVNYRNLISCP